MQTASLPVPAATPAPLWMGIASNNRGILRVVPVTLGLSTHYVLTLDFLPVANHDDVDALIHMATHEWAEVNTGKSPS